MRLCCIAYLPPPGKCQVEAFRQNLEANPPASDLLLYSDHAWAGVTRLKGNPEQVRNTARADGKANVVAVNNLIFFTGLKLALQRGYTHMLYLETDCRVKGAGWDKRVFDEFFDGPTHSAMGGSMVIYNPSNDTEETRIRAAEITAQNAATHYPVPTYGSKGANERGGACVFIMGALGIYDLRWLSSLFDIDGKTLALASASHAWDYQIGAELFQRFGSDTFDLVKHMTTVFSSYGDVVTSLEQRKQMLHTGQVVAVHQVKDNWVP